MKKETKYRIPYFFIGAIFLLQSCIESYTPHLNMDDSKPLLVVEGQITDEKGSFKVRLTESVLLNNDPNVGYVTQPVWGANVQIFDDKGNLFRLYHAQDGWYETENKQLQAVVENTYTLTITTPDGREYESSPVLMRAVPDIQNLHCEEFTNIRFEDEVPVEETWVKVLVDSEVPEKKDVFLQWKFEETWVFKMPLRILVHHESICPAGCPPPTWESIDVDYKKIKCWVSESSREILVESTAGYQDNQISNFVLQTIGPNSDRLNIKYSILVKQYALGRDLYSYFKKLHETSKETEGMFAKIPGQVFGNINCCDSDEKALGYFNASSVKTKRLFIADYIVKRGNAYSNCYWNSVHFPDDMIYLYGTYTDMSGNIQNVWAADEYCTDCRSRGTNIEPDFWE